MSKQHYIWILHRVYYYTPVVQLYLRNPVHATSSSSLTPSYTVSRLFESLVGLRLVVSEASDETGDRDGHAYKIAWPREISNSHEADLASIERLAVERYGRVRTAAGQADVASLIVGKNSPTCQISYYNKFYYQRGTINKISCVFHQNVTDCLPHGTPHPTNLCLGTAEALLGGLCHTLMREVCIDDYSAADGIDDIAWMMVPDASSGVTWAFYDATTEEASVRPYLSDEVRVVDVTR